MSPQCVPGTTVTNYDKSEQEDSFSSDPHPVSGDNGYGTWKLSHPASGSLSNSHITKGTPVRVTEELLPDDEASATLETSTSGPGPPEKEDFDVLTIGQDGHVVLENIDELNDDNGTPSARDREEMWCSPCTQCTDLDLTLSKQSFVCERVARRHHDIENSASNTENSAVFTLMDYNASEGFSKSEMVLGSSPQPQPAPPLTELEIDRQSFLMYEKPDYKSFYCSLGD